MVVLGEIQNKNINVHVSVSGQPGSQIEHELIQRIRLDDPSILEEVISHGQMDVEYVTDGSVVLQLRPVTDDAVKTLLNAKENNRLLEMIFGIMKKAKMHQTFDKSCQIRVQIYYAKSAVSMSSKCLNRLKSFRFKHFG